MVIILNSCPVNLRLLSWRWKVRTAALLGIVLSSDNFVNRCTGMTLHSVLLTVGLDSVHYRRTRRT